MPCSLENYQWPDSGVLLRLLSGDSWGKRVVLRFLQAGGQEQKASGQQLRSAGSALVFLKEKRVCWVVFLFNCLCPSNG